jgi:transcriptional adapter 3
MAGPGNNKSKSKAQARDRQSLSRNTTPISSASASVVVVPKDMASRRTMDRSISPYLQTSLVHPSNLATKLSDSPVADIFDGSSSAFNIPSAGTLNAISESIRTQLLSIARLRDEACDRMIRELALRKKERVERDRIRDLEQAKREADERRLQLKKATTTKKRDREEERPLAVGAHGVARQDGMDGSASRMGKSLLFTCIRCTVNLEPSGTCLRKCPTRVSRIHEQSSVPPWALPGDMSQWLLQSWSLR